MAPGYCYYISIADLTRIQGSEPTLRYTGTDPFAFGVVLQDALRHPHLFRCWKAMQAQPDEVDPALGVVDPHARVKVQLVDLHIALEVRTCLPMRLLQQRLNWLIGPHWQLRDVCHN